MGVTFNLRLYRCRNQVKVLDRHISIDMGLLLEIIVIVQLLL